MTHEDELCAAIESVAAAIDRFAKIYQAEQEKRENRTSQTINRFDQAFREAGIDLTPPTELRPVT